MDSIRGMLQHEGMACTGVCKDWVLDILVSAQIPLAGKMRLGLDTVLFQKGCEVRWSRKESTEEFQKG